MKEIIIAKDKQHLKQLVNNEININGNECNLNHIDVSSITDMSFLFENSKFNGDVSQWNVSNVTNMCEMFINSEFNGDISKWDVSKVTNMKYIFGYAKFNQDISEWNLVKNKNFIEMITDCPAPKPYWYRDNNELTIEIIKKYKLYKDLEKNLENTINIKKIKL